MKRKDVGLLYTKRFYGEKGWLPLMPAGLHRSPSVRSTNCTISGKREDFVAHLSHRKVLILSVHISSMPPRAGQDRQA
jgi:hypothetical protein